MGEVHHHVATALLVCDGRVLLCHRHPDRRWYPDVWDLPGGHIDGGETPADALRRELREELGISVDLSSLEPWRVLTPAPDLTLNIWVVDRWQGTVENLARYILKGLRDTVPQVVQVRVWEGLRKFAEYSEPLD